MQLAGAVILVALMQPVGAAVVAPPSAPSVSPVQPPLAEDAPWPVARGDARNTGRLRDGVAKALAAPVSPWRFPVDGAVVAVPVIDGAERIYVGTTTGTLHVFDPFAGREPWRVALGEPISAAAALGPDREIYVAAGAHLAAVSVDGATRWAFDARRDRDRCRVTLGVGDNWQGGIAISPDGDVCAGNDDFFVYCLDARGRVAWARRVGLPIWAPVAFGHDGTAYVPSLDMNLYALAAATGAVRWRRDLGAPLATAAAVGDDGTLYVGATDGQVHALDGDSGTVRWSTRAGAPVLAPPAVATDGTVYVASTDGRLAALDAASGAARWTYWFADRLRTAPAIGPDPEGRGSHLVYVGGGDGGLYALAPDGRPRWVYEPAAPGNTAGRPAIESGPALGRYGAAVGTAAGAVHYVPYDYYLRDGASNVRRPAVPAVAPAPQWRVVEPDGSLHERPLTTVKTDANPITVGRTEVVTLRALQTERPATGAGEVPSADGFEVRTAPGKYRVVPLGDRLSLALVPRAILPGVASLPLSVSGRFAAPGGGDDLFEGHAVLQTEAESVENPLALGLHRGFRLTRLTVSQPPALAALLGPALHSIAIPFVVVETLPEWRTFAAWALQVSETGGPRLLSAWRGQWSGDAMVMEATSVFVAIAGIAVPIDRLRFAGRFAPGGQVAPGATLFAEVRPP
ncbi:PQQ-binding-like beta-propeller repeat protein, partial [Candidatus Binatia bacterium]|nr:PQQ-binding-like beta-propeller repeat protein [Candidatus Binatia bacterium]